MFVYVEVKGDIVFCGYDEYVVYVIEYLVLWFVVDLYDGVFFWVLVIL